MARVTGRTGTGVVEPGGGVVGSRSTTSRLVRKFSPWNADACERQSESSKVVSGVMVPVSSPEPSGL